MTRPVAVVQSGDAFENRGRVLPLAIALREHGWDPVVLVDDLGAASLFLLHDVACVAVGAAREGAFGDGGVEADPEELCPLKLRALDMGGRALPDAEWREIAAASRRLWALLDALDPAAAFVWNGFTGVWANALRVFKARRGLPGGFMERGPAADAVFVDAAGVNGHASFAGGPETSAAPVAATPEPPEDLAPAAESPRGLTARFRALLGGFPRTPPSTPLANGRERIVFVPLQVQDDSNILLHSPRILRMRDLVRFGLALAEALGPDWRVVARPHPEERAGVRLNLAHDPRITLDAETSLDEYLARAAVCLTINSAVGLSAALAGAVTACLGEGVYCRQPFVAAAQDCDVFETAGEIRRRLDAPSPAEAAGRFMDDFSARALFRLTNAPALNAARLTRCGLAPADGRDDVAPAPAVVRRGPAYRSMLERLNAIRAASGDVAVDFDFEPDETLFLTYRRNREPLTRAHLAACAGALFGRPAQLSPTHRALGARGRVLLTHSKRLPDDIGGYDLVLDEFGLPHARSYLDA